MGTIYLFFFVFLELVISYCLTCPLRFPNHSPESQLSGIPSGLFCALPYRITFALTAFCSNGLPLTSDPKYSPREYFLLIVIYQAANICVSHLSISAGFIFPCRAPVKMLNSTKYTSKPCRKPVKHPHLMMV